MNQYVFIMGGDLSGTANVSDAEVDAFLQALSEAWVGSIDTTVSWDGTNTIIQCKSQFEVDLPTDVGVFLRSKETLDNNVQQKKIVTSDSPYPTPRDLAFVWSETSHSKELNETETIDLGNGVKIFVGITAKGQATFYNAFANARSFVIYEKLELARIRSEAGATVVKNLNHHYAMSKPVDVTKPN